MKLSKLKKLIKEELEVILTNEEVGDFFGEDIQAKLEEGIPGGGMMANPAETEEAEAAELSAEKGSVNVEPMEESNAGEAAEALTGKIPDAEIAQVVQSIEDLLHDPELSQGLSDEQRNELETILNFILKGRMGEGVEDDEEEMAWRTPRARAAPRGSGELLDERGRPGPDAGWKLRVYWRPAPEDGVELPPRWDRWDNALRSRGVRVPWNLRYGGSGVGLGLRYHVLEDSSEEWNGTRTVSGRVRFGRSS